MTIINRNNNDNKHFKYAATAAPNYESIGKNPRKTAKIIPFIEKKFETNLKKTITLNVPFLPIEGGLKKITQAYMSKHNSECEHQVILVMIKDNEKWHSRAVKSWSRLLYKITSSYNHDHYCKNCLLSLRAENKLKYAEEPKLL